MEPALLKVPAGKNEEPAGGGAVESSPGGGPDGGLSEGGGPAPFVAFEPAGEAASPGPANPARVFSLSPK